MCLCRCFPSFEAYLYLQFILKKDLSTLLSEKLPVLNLSEKYVEGASLCLLCVCRGLLYVLLCRTLPAGTPERGAASVGTGADVAVDSHPAAGLVDCGAAGVGTGAADAASGWQPSLR